MKKIVLPAPSLSLVPPDFNEVALQVASSIDGEDTAYRIYAEAMAKWVKSRFAGVSPEIPVIPSAPQNAFSNYRKLLVELGVLKDCPDNPRDYSNLPLPLASVHQTGDDIREGSVGGFPLRNLGVHKETNEMFTRYPKPMWFNYSIDLWALKKRHISWMKHRLEMSFLRQVAHTSIKHCPLVDTKFLTAIWREGSEDQSQVSRGATEELLLHTVFMVKVEAWMWDDILYAPRILELQHDGDDTGLADVAFSEGANIIKTPTDSPPD